MKKLILAFLSVLFFSQLSIAQTQFADITVTVQSVTHNDQCGCNDQGFFQCGIASSQPDPRWNVKSRLSGGGFSPVTFIQYDDQNCTTSSRSDVVETYSGTCDDVILIETESWEEDDAPNNTNNGVDDNYSGFETFSISYQLDPTSSLNTYTLNLSNGYQVEIGVFWTVAATVGPPAISGNTNLCSGDALSVTASQASATNFNWYNVPSGGTPISTGATLNVPNVTANISYYVAGSIGTCEGPRTQVDVIVETPPNAGTGVNTPICDTENSFDLFTTLSGNDVGGAWNDDNGTGALTGSSFNATGLGGGSYDFTYTVSGTFCPIDNETVTLTVEQSPNAGTATNTTICSSVNLFDLFSTLSGNDPGGTWNDDDASGALSVNFLDATLMSAGIYNFTYTLSGTVCSSSAVTVAITIDEISTDPSSLAASNSNICAAGPVDFTVIGGSLGTGAQWELYSGSGSCGTTLEGTSLTGSFNGINVSATENYFVLATGICNTTNCASTTVTLSTISIDPTDLTASDTIVCSGDLVVLNVVGGSLGTNATWEWYSGSCGGNSEGNGSSITVSPLDTTAYYVRGEGTCGNTVCDSVEIAIIPAFISLDSALADDYNVCPEDPVQLTAYYSTSLPSNYIITWYTGACGAVPIGVGDNITVNPTDTTIYYVQCVGTCGVSACDTVQVNVQDGSTSPGSVTASNNNFCVGGNSTLTVNGGTLGLGAQWSWYEGSCASTVIATGTSINVSPTASTMYYVRAVGSSCGPTACVSIFINVFAINVFQVPFDTLCSNDSTPYTLNGGNPTGGTYSGTGVSNGVFDPIVAGLGTHTITYSYTDPNGCNGSVDEDIVIKESNLKPETISASTTEICDGSYAVLWLDSLQNDLIPGTMWVWYEGECGGGTPIDTTYNLNTYLFDNTGAPILDPITGDHLYVHDTIVVSPSSTTNYYVRTEGGECGPTDCLGITVDVYTLETNLLSFNNVCGTDVPAFDLTGGIPSGGTYSGTGVTNNVFDPFSAGIGTHDITYTYSSAGCTITDVETITIHSSTINVYHTIEQESCSEGGILIHLHTTGGSGFYSYLWSDGSIEAPLMYAQPGDYTVLVSDANDCSTLHGPINISEELGCIEMPNSFTPNGDGTNDTWNLDFSMYGGAQLSIYSKWGNLVYQINADIISWDGNYNNMPLPAGTYYYILQLENGADQNGPVTIVR